MKKISGGVTAAKGFRAAGVHAGLKKRKPDLALILSENLCAAAGCLTQNQIKAAPVLITQKLLKSGRARGILANSGSANCCTGTKGHKTALALQKEAATVCGIKPSELLLASTGTIGKQIPFKTVQKSIPALAGRLSPKGSQKAAEAILTTDLVTKSAAVTVHCGGRAVKIGGIAKGSGMIDPSMATMLAFVTTDAVISSGALRKATRRAVQGSFNNITVDGQMSTNDTVLVLANGAAGNRSLQPGRPGWSAWLKGLQFVMQQLAEQIAQDGEGASALLRVEVRGTGTHAQAHQVAKKIANAPLVKTMVTGRDPNWGRVAATVGASSVRFNPRQLEIRLGGVPVFRNEAPLKVAQKKLKNLFSGKSALIQVRLGSGKGEATVLGCDLTQGYVRINAKYN
jgi:glutamate N-acetyltransferase / amino-acid N-acetyltransferase